MQGASHVALTSPVSDQHGGRSASFGRAAAAAAVAGLAFGVALPRIADYGSVVEVVRGLTPGVVIMLALLGLWNLFTYWPVMVLSLPSLRLREAAVVNQASTAVANTVPAGSAVALGVTVRMLRTWGFSPAAIANHVFVTGLWNQLAKLLLPLAAVVLLVVTDELDGELVRAAAVGLGIAALVLTALAASLRAEATTRRLGTRVDALFDRWRARRGEPLPERDEPWLLTVRHQLTHLVHHAGGRLSVATLVSHLSLYTVLLGALRGAGVSDSEASASRIFATFAFVRLLSAVPITPGGVGVVELGYVAALTVGTDAAPAAEVAAGVLLFRAITYLLPIGLGAVAWAIHLRADGWRTIPRPAEPSGGGLLA